MIQDLFSGLENKSKSICGDNGNKGSEVLIIQVFIFWGQN